MSRKHKRKIQPLAEGTTKREEKDLNPENMGPSPKPIKPAITATATTEGIKEFAERFNKKYDDTVQPGK